MEKNTLGEVIEAEKKIRARLDEEQRNAERHLKEAGAQAARVVEEAEQRLRGSVERAVAEAEAAARRKAGAIRREARDWDLKLKALDEAVLRRLVLKHIAAILPEPP